MSFEIPANLLYVHGFRSEMASGGDNGNLVQDFEEAFQVEFMAAGQRKKYT